jgi:hypothetical protein
VKRERVKRERVKRERVKRERVKKEREGEEREGEERDFEEGGGVGTEMLVEAVQSYADGVEKEKGNRKSELRRERGERWREQGV